MEEKSEMTKRENLIEKFQIKANGYHPFLIRDGWQVAQLNYMPEQEIENITRLDVHRLTDEVFILLKGHAVLIAAEITESGIRFQIQLMEPNITYNIPVGTWHNIAMCEGCEVILVEKSNTHISDFEHYELNHEQQEELKHKVSTILNNVQSLK